MAVSASASKASSRGRTKKGRSRKPALSATPEQLHDYYREMLLIRRFEEKAGQLYGMGLIGGFCHLYIGQEAVVTGMQAAMEDGDTVVTSYRDHGHTLACGMDPRSVMAELTGRESGVSKGKGGSMHMFSRENNFYGGHGIVGAQVPIGTGIAFAHRYKEDGRVCLTYLGDGAINQGQVYESFNMAELWDLPVVYIIENNKYGMGTSVERASANPDLHVRGEAYGIPGKQVDGMDVLAVHDAGAEAIEFARSGKGPYILKETARPTAQGRQERDPIERLRVLMIEEGVADDAALKEIDREIKNIVSDAAEFAQNSPEPDPSELYTDVLVEA